MRLTIFWSLLTAMVISPFCAGVPIDTPCSEEDLAIDGGTYSLTQGLEAGSKLIYKCPEGYYAHPTPSRRCLRGGTWEPTPNKNHRAECRAVTCPDPWVFKNGAVLPDQIEYYASNRTTYECFVGYRLRGSETRICQPNGKWSGSTPICDRADHCPDPGIPPGTRRTGDYFGIDDKVTYRCDEGLTLLGSEERVCQESKEWTGIEPACYSKFTFDTPQEATEMFGASLKRNLIPLLAKNKPQGGRRIYLNQDPDLHIYIALDISDNVDKKDFNGAKDCVKKLIEKMSYFEVDPLYDVMAFASDVKMIKSITDPPEAKINVITALDKFQYDDKGDRSGTDIGKAFQHILDQMSYMRAQNETKFLEIRHVIIMFTHGVSNMGGGAKPKVDKIRSLVNNEENLDIYIFGLGEDPNMKEIDTLVSKKPNERHFYKLRDYTSLEETFEEMIDENIMLDTRPLQDYDKGTDLTKH